MKDLILQFIDEKLDGNIENLSNFDLLLLSEDRKFGCNKRSFDCDDTNIARAIYVIVFEDVWPELSYESFVSKKYRGDTINTFGTLFGEIDKGVIKGFDKIAKDSDLRPKVLDFYYLM